MKILFLDGMNTEIVSIATYLYDAAKSHNVECEYVNLKNIRVRFGYRIIAFFKRYAYRRKQKGKSYYIAPKLSLHTLKKILQDAQPTVIVAVGSLHYYLSKKDSDSLRKQLGFKWAFYDTDGFFFLSDRSRINFYLKEELSRFDIIFTFSNSFADFLKRAHFNSVKFLPYGSHRFEVLKTKASSRQDLLFVGGAEFRRLFYLEKLADLNIKVYGGSWRKYISYMSQELREKIIFRDIKLDELSEEIFSSKIVLNIVNAESKAIDAGANLRAFEAMAHGVMLLTDYCEEVDEIFSIGEHLDVFNNAHELRKKVEFYLSHNDKRESIARSGYDIVTAQYTWNSVFGRMHKVLRESI